MKIFFGVLAVCLCVAASYKMADKYTERRKFYESFGDFNKKLKNEVYFTRKTIISVLEENSNKNDFFYKSVNEYYHNNKQRVRNVKIFSEEETDFFNKYLEILGVSDGASQIKHIEATENYISDKFSQAVDNEKKYKSLYVKLGFLLGLLIFVLII